MISVVIALYNEHERFPTRYPALREFLETIKEPWELILVDDGSRDGTLSMIEDLAKKDGRVRALSLGRNYGQGAGVKIGVLASHGDVVLYTDGDLAIPFKWFTELIARVRKGSDVAIASRWMYGATITVPQPALRRRLGKIYYWLIHALVLSDIHDANCGLKAYRGDAARTLFGFVRAWRWVFNIEHLWVAHWLGYSIAEIPIEWSHTPASKVRVWRDCLFTLWELGMLKLRQFMKGYPKLAVRP